MSAPAVAAPTPPTTIPWMGLLAVLLGTFISTLNTRLSTFGIADIRGALHAGARVAIPVSGGAAAGQALRRLAFAQVPVFGWFDEGGVQDRGGDLEPAAGFQCAAHAL